MAAESISSDTQLSRSPSPVAAAADWDRLRQLAEAETGMNLSGERLSRLTDAVRNVLTEDKTPRRLEAILASHDQRAVFLERVTAELTVGESFFFRNRYHFDALSHQVLPRIIAENRNRREIRIWSAGCASGEETYSLAIALDRLAQCFDDWHVSILGTDLNPEFLERARTGVYRPWSFRGTDIQLDDKYFQSEGQEYRLNSEVRRHVRFAYLNLVKDVYPSLLNGTWGLDLILFRNVAIYLKPDVVDSILTRFYQALRPGGWLLLGETELNLAGTRSFESQRFEHAVFHRRPLGERLTEKPMPAAVPVLTGANPLPRLVKGTFPAEVTCQEPLADETRWHRICHHLDRQEWESAERLIDSIARVSQRSALRLRYAEQLVALADVHRADRMLQRCLEEEPLQIETHLLQASLAEESGDLARAERAYRRALYLDRQCSMAHFHLAMVQHQRGDIAGAKSSLAVVQRLIGRHDAAAVVPHGDGVCYGRLEEMVRIFQESLTRQEREPTTS